MSLQPIETFTVKLLKKVKINNNVWSFSFKKPTGFEFRAGQYMNITLPMLNDKEETYSFTISSAPYEDQLSLTTNKTETSFKKVLFDLVPEKEITIRGPIGGFIFSDVEKQLVFLSGGIGVTPFRSIIHDFVNRNLPTRLTLIASFSKKEDILFYDELKELENNRIQIVYTITNEEAEGFEKGRISEELVEKYVPNSSTAEFGLAGRGEMVDDMVVILRRMGVKNANIKTDIFTGL